jgi:hypothetical protein
LVAILSERQFSKARTFVQDVSRGTWSFGA